MLPSCSYSHPPILMSRSYSRPLILPSTHTPVLFILPSTHTPVPFILPSTHTPVPFILPYSCPIHTPVLLSHSYSRPVVQPKSAAASGQSTEAVIEKTTKDILAKIPQNMDLKAVMQKYPLMYEESMNTVLSQEIMRYTYFTVLGESFILNTIK